MTSQIIEQPPATQSLPAKKVGVKNSVINKSALSEKAILFKHLNTEIPNNDIGLPTHYYRSDLLPSDLLSLGAEEQADLLDMATVELDYGQGYPTIDGEPFWSLLPHEPAEAYRAFTAYLDLPYRAEDAGGSAPVRQLHLLSIQLSLPTSKLVEMSYMYYWHTRTRSYDMFKLAAHTRLREQRGMHLENDHYTMASQYIAFADSFLQDVFLDPVSAGLKPRDAMDLLIKMIQVQRLSVGMAPFSAGGSGGGKDSNGLPANASLEVILRTLATQMGTNQNQAIEGAADADLATLTKKILSNPDELAKAQELIIRVNSHGDRTRNLAPASIDENPYDNRS